MKTVGLQLNQYDLYFEISAVVDTMQLPLCSHALCFPPYAADQHVQGSSLPTLLRSVRLLSSLAEGGRRELCDR